MRLRERYPQDEWYYERLSASTAASLVVHFLLALLLFAVLAGSSEQGATENVTGGEVISMERTSPVQLQQPPASVRVSAAVPHAPQIAPVRHAQLSQPQAQRLPQNFHELAVPKPSAPPNPRPIPQESVQPNPQPTQNIFEVQPRNEAPAVPVTVPTVAPVAVSAKLPPTAPPSPAATVAPSARPSPKPPAPTAAPSARPATPAPAAPSPAPSATAVAIARASAAPSTSPAPVSRVSAAPSAVPGVPSPSPTRVETPVRTAGTAASPGPKPLGSPGPGRAGPVGTPVPARPVEVRPMPTPAPPRPVPKPATGVDINARLRAMLPSGPVHPTSKEYTPTYSLHGHLEPTPPPDVLAATKYLYDVHGTGGEREVKMWVISYHQAGPTTMCRGWMIRYPAPVAGNYAPVPTNDNIAAANGTQIGIGGGHGGGGPVSPFYSGEAPIVEGMVSTPCNGRLLVPFAGSPAPSP